jgi:hypothetical protein
MKIKHPIRLALFALLAVATVASAQLYPLFGPSTGILKGTVSSPQTSAAASSDVAALWSGTCNSSSFLRGDGVCATPSGGSGTVTSITAGTGLTGGTITTSGTIALSSPVSATNGGTGEAGTVSGVMKGNNTSAVTAAASSDVIALWTGTCNSTTFLRGDGTCAAAGGGSTPVPGTIPDLVFWLQADTILGSSSGPWGLPVLQNSTPWLTAWSPLVQGAGTGVLVSGTQLNSKNVLAWPGGGGNARYQFPVNSGASAQTGIKFLKITIFVVANVISYTNSPTFLSGLTGALDFRMETSGKLGLVKDSISLIATSTTAITVSTWYQGNATYDDSTGAYAFRTSQAANGSGTLGTAGLTAISTAIGYDIGASSGDISGSIAEIIIYNRVLSGSEITSVEGYLNTKWGV